MKLVRVVVDGRIVDGRYENEQIVGTDSTRYDPADVIWLPPGAQSSKAIGLALNYSDRAIEFNLENPEAPVLFNKNPNTFVGHKGKVVYPTGAEYVHYENELVVVIGQRCRRVKAERAADVILGYTIGNDVTVRDFVTNYYRPPIKAKGFDTFGPLGPWVVTADELPDVSNLELRTTVNGEVRQQGNTRDLTHSVPELIEYITAFMTLEPGDMIWTGSPQGISHIFPGDVMVCEIDGIGSLENEVIAEEQS
jgi:5-oxopent-3-ene-1,2,5-tricarboxylate decarboxylase / 2-hydroxyhepta-2,4-diene-1,7-dioate isomerase